MHLSLGRKALEQGEVLRTEKDIRKRNKNDSDTFDTFFLS